jgi:LysR family glycine cleavage system transcriptional activator
MHFPIILAALSALPKVHDRHNLWPDEFADLGIADKNKGDLRLSQTAFAVNVASFGQRSALVSHFLVSSDLAAGNPKKIKALQTLLHIISTF